MALPLAGSSISISQIAAEFGNASYSLNTLSSLAGFSTPDAMSEFYGISNVFWDLNSAFYDGYGYLAIYNVTQGWTTLVDISGAGYYNGNFTVNVEDQLYIYIYGQSSNTTNLALQVTVYVSGDPVDGFSDYWPDSTYIESAWYYTVGTGSTYLSIYVGDL